MNKAIIRSPRYEQWTRQRPQEYALIDNKKLRPEPEIGEWVFAPHEPEGNDDGPWLSARLALSGILLQEAVSVDPDIRGGVPVLRGTRITVAQVLVEIAEGESVDGFAEEYDIDVSIIRKFFDGLAINLDRSYLK